MLGLTLVLLALAHHADAAAPASMVIPQYAPCFGKPVHKDLVSFSIEMDRWDNFAGSAVGSPNEYTNQILNNLAALTGQQPSVRVGANSEDNGYVNSSVQVIGTTFPAPTAVVPYPEASIIDIGRDFYRLSVNLPKGTKFTWGINFKAQNVTETVAQAKQLYDTWYGDQASLLADHHFELLEIGNEPDLGVLQLTQAYDWVSRWVPFAQAVDDAVDIGSHPTRLQIAAFALSASAPNNYGAWNVPATLGADILGSSVGSLIKRYSLHHYSGANLGQTYPNGLLFNKNTIRSNLSDTTVNGMYAKQAGLEFVLGETNSYARHGIPKLSNGGESAIWLADYALRAAASGIDKLYFHHGLGFAYNLFAPIAGNFSDGTGIVDQPHVLPSYYGALLASELIGQEENNMVAELSLNSTVLAGYGVWGSGGNLLRAVVLNSEVYLNGTRNSTTVSLIDAPQGGFTLKRLSLPNSAQSTGITYAGVSYESADGKPQGTAVTETYTGSSFSMNATEAVLLNFNRNQRQRLTEPRKGLRAAEEYNLGLFIAMYR